MKLTRHFARAIAVVGVLAFCAGPALAATTVSAQTAPVVATAPAAGAGPTEVAQANPFADVPPNSWAYQAIAKLASEGLIKGYPDGQFKGQRPITRYEAAVLVNRVVDYLEAKISAGQQVSADQMATVKALVDQFGPELKQVQAHLNDLDTKVAALNTQVQANSAALNRQQFHLSLAIRPGDYQANVSAFTNYTFGGAAPGCVGAATAPCAVKPSTALVYGNNPGGGDGAQNKPVSGQNTFGTAWADLRLNWNGVIDPQWSYATRLEVKFYAENAGLPNGSAATTPQFCGSIVNTGTVASVTCPSDYPYPAPRLDIAAIKWNSPLGFHWQIGRIAPGYGNDLGGLAPQLILSDYVSGTEIGYTKPNGLDVNVGYFFWFPATSSGSGSTTLDNTIGTGQATPAVCTLAAGCPGQSTTAQTAQDIYGDIAYTFIPNHLNLGAAWLLQSGYTGVFWDPSANSVSAPAAGLPAGSAALGVSGLYEPATIPIGTGSIFGTYKFNGPIWLQAEFAHRFGDDPYTGATWQQPNGLWADATIGNYAGGPGTLWAEAGYEGNGFNAISPETNLYSTLGYNQLYLANAGGYQIYYAGVHYKPNTAMDLGLIYQHYALLPGIDLPAGSAACPGCYITQDSRNMVFANIWMNF